jgi:hypothetical protein
MTWVDSVTKTIHCKDSITKSVTIATVPNIISGYIFQDSTKAVATPQYKVWLIVYNSTAGTLTAVDSLTVTGTGMGYSTAYQFTGAASGSYRTKAKLMNGPSSGMGALPTYHNNSLLWSSATVITHTGVSTTGKNIVLQYGTVTSGPGFIGGLISAGANKGTGAGIPNMTVLLLSSTGTPVASTTTDANGNYSFSNLAPATYKVHPEDAGFTTTEATATIVSGSPTVNGINFSRSISGKTITPSAVGITNISKQAFVVYPNPTIDIVTVEWNSDIANNASIIITDIAGKTINSTNGTNGKAVINIIGAPKGLYFMTIKAGNEATTQKLIVQ